MSQWSEIPPKLLPHASLQPLTRRNQKQLLVAFWLGAIPLLLYELYFPGTTALLTNLGALLITIAALIPTYLWCSGKANGMPVFPLFTVPYVWTHALPLLNPPPTLEQYSIQSEFVASLTTSGFLFLGAIVWFQCVKSVPPPPKFYRALGSQKGDQFFFWSLAISTLFNIANAGGWLNLDAGVFSLVRNVIVALTALGAFVLSYRLGTEELTGKGAQLFISLLGAFMVTSAISLLLVGAATVFLSALAAFIIGRKQIPVVTTALVMAVFFFLQPGKGDLRKKYWFNESQATPYIQPWQYPALFAEWIDASLKYSFRTDNLLKAPQLEDRQSFAERASVIQMLLLAQQKSPSQLPFLYGKTYLPLPELVVPRVLNPKKIRSHEGTYILSIYYGLQRLEDTNLTTIAWGLLAEAYANFGQVGCAGLAVIIGLVFGLTTRWSIGAPILSMRAMFTVLMLTFALQTEWTAGVYVAAFFQYVVVLIGIAIVLMNNYRVSTLSEFMLESDATDYQLRP